LDAGTEPELTVYSSKVGRPYLDEALDLHIDMLCNSLYDPAEIERELMVVIEEQNMANDSPGHRADRLMDQMLWPDHQLGRDVGGTRESVSGMTREMLLDHGSRFYTPGNIVLSVAGDVDHDEIARTVESLGDGWSSRRPPAWVPFTHVQSAPQLRVEYRRTEQAQLLIGLPGLSATHPDRYALDLLSAVLGEGMSSRLFLEVREKRGLAYDIRSGVTHFLDTGAFVVAAGVDPKRAYETVEIVLAELARLRDRVPDSEMVRAKRLSTGMLVLRMEDTRAVSSWNGSQELLLGEVQDVDEVIEQVEGVTPEDLRRVANDLLTGDRLNMALVGPVRGEVRFQRALSRALA
jgi:predicted Zn-dependent peptidase